MSKTFHLLSTLTTIALICIGFGATAQPIDNVTAAKIAQSRLIRDGMAPQYTVNNMELLPGHQGQPLFYFVTLKPQGFIIVSANNNLPPVIAYGYDIITGHTVDFLRFVANDLNKRMDCLSELPPSVIEQRNREWTLCIQEYQGNPGFQQWPEPGSTATGGWLETNWTQDFPYNSMCPLDPVTGNRSVAGCPAVAMAMIVNFHQTTNEVVFTNADDYHHVYAGRNYWIDNDYQTIGFPSFPMLNDYLDTLMVHYIEEAPLTKNDKAAMVFACGVAAKQVYTSSGSGTFGVDQAYDAYQKFNFTTAELYTDSDTSIYTKMARNIMDTLPVHLAVVDPGWTMGHNVVVDGYNTDHYFHLNFGWGGSYNGWYLLPDEIPYGLTVIEGAVIDILPDFATGQADQSIPGIFLFPNPFNGPVTIKNDGQGEIHLSVCSFTGQVLFHASPFSPVTTFDLSHLPKGVYLMTVKKGQSVYSEKMIKL